MKQLSLDLARWWQALSRGRLGGEMMATCAVEHYTRAHMRTLLAEAERERLLAPLRPPHVWAAVWAAVRARFSRAGRVGDLPPVGWRSA